MIIKGKCAIEVGHSGSVKAEKYNPVSHSGPVQTIYPWWGEVAKWLRQKTAK